MKLTAFLIFFGALSLVGCGITAPGRAVQDGLVTGAILYCGKTPEERSVVRAGVNSQMQRAAARNGVKSPKVKVVCPGDSGYDE